jgi:hypothetical protein
LDDSALSSATAVRALVGIHSTSAYPVPFPFGAFLALSFEVKPAFSVPGVRVDTLDSPASRLDEPHPTPVPTLLHICVYISIPATLHTAERLQQNSRHRQPPFLVLEARLFVVVVTRDLE